MKKMTLLLAGILLGSSLFAQLFTVTELFSLNRLKKEEFKTALLKKGYVPFKDTEDEYGTGFLTYSFPGSGYRVIRGFENRGNNGDLTLFETTSKADYDELKKQVLAAGFIFYEGLSEDDGSSLNYATKELVLNLEIHDEGFGLKYAISVIQ